MGFKAKVFIVILIIFSFVGTFVGCYFIISEKEKSTNDYDIVGKYVGSIMDSDGQRHIDVYTCGNDTIYTFHNMTTSIAVK